MSSTLYLQTPDVRDLHAGFALPFAMQPIKTLSRARSGPSAARLA